MRRGSDRLERGGRGGNRPTPSHRRSVRQEHELAARFNGRVTPGSGSKDTKGDVRVRGVCRIEAKTTKHKSFSVTLEMSDKIEQAALMNSEIPILVVEFITQDGHPIKELAVTPVWVLEQLIENQIG
jgi:hypothetical protein